MTHDLFNQLADSDVPPVPPQLDVQVHRRLNSALLTAHLLEFAWRALPQTLGTFLGSVAHLIMFTATGRFKENLDDRPPTP